MEKYSTTVGIDDLSVYVPHLYLPIETLAEVRAIEYAKLNKGLGLQAMSIPDVQEDAATMAANAALELILKNKLDPRRIGRLYVGTESAVDGAKPIASYVTGMLAQYFEPTYGADCMLGCDAVDLTFACIGAVDALQNTLDWAKGNPSRIGIVIATDIAKYELGSGGEYTQGAGAVAMLVKQQPRLLAISDAWGTATMDVHDFFKPIRHIRREDVATEVLEALQVSASTDLSDAPVQAMPAKGILDATDAWVQLHRDTPIFDGQYSNQCYQERVRQAYHRFIGAAFGYMNGHPGPVLSGRWQRLVFHLPYAYHARRIFAEIYLEEALKSGQQGRIEQETGAPLPEPAQIENYLKLVSKTPGYQSFVNKYIEKGERASSLVGNIYTGSIFLALMSTLEADLQEEATLNTSKIGFFAYGSGSKSKVFEGELQPQWREVVQGFQLFERLKRRQAINYETYEQLHRGKQETPVGPLAEGFTLVGISDDPVLPGVRQYQRQRAYAMTL
ncbi:MAG TPA: hydroxymethylglutaryl-CoA synthase [Saprospiraceae bacterium]|nr:hydroxymethylglutaryl-CoA synthase [Saprospiraceae bacterium]